LEGENMSNKIEIGTDRLIKECVENYEHDDPDEIYKRCLKNVKGVDLIKIMKLKTADGNTIVKDYLYRWGTMGRVLGRKEHRGWENRLAKQIQLNAAELAKLRKKHLEGVDLNKYEKAISECYESIRKAEGSPIAAAKILHLICPDFFPVWDNAIANALRRELVCNQSEDFSALDYFRFMQVQQRLLRCYKQVLSELAKKYGKGNLKILDEFLWFIVRRPLYMFLRNVRLKVS
jgi:hypothetical protein